ncbi:MAG: HAD-IC family P-type ATPase, partial [Oscillospiraceae bacterium]
MKHYLMDKEKVLSSLGTGHNGLSSEEAQKRLEENGKNKLVEAKKVSLLHRFLSQLADPMILVLLVAAGLSGVTSAYSGESFADVFIILFVVILNSVLGVVQESKAEEAIAALREMTAATSKVLRNGHHVTVRSEDLVVGDVLVLEAGDSVPADARILSCASMKIDEAALTGESVPVVKTAEGLAGDQEITLGDRKNMAYMGSIVVYGHGTAVVCATGMDTEMGKIATALSQAQQEATPLQIKLAGLSRILTRLVLIISVFIFVIGIIKAGSLSTIVVIDTFMLAVSLAVAAIPEGLAAVVTIVLSIGVTNMSKKKAIIRKLTAVETL